MGKIKPKKIIYTNSGAALGFKCLMYANQYIVRRLPVAGTVFMRWYSFHLVKKEVIC